MSTGVVVTHAFRSAVGKANRGSLRETRPDELLGLLIQGFLERVPGLDPADIDDVLIGCAMPEGEQGLNIGRNAALRAGSARRGACHDRKPVLQFWIADAGEWCGADSGRLVGHSPHRRGRVDVDGADERQQALLESVAGRELPGSVRVDGHDQRNRRRTIRNHPSRPGCVRGRVQQPGSGGHRRRPVRR